MEIFLFFELFQFFETLLDFLHLLSMAATLPEADGKSNDEGEQGETNDEQDFVRGEGVSGASIESELRDVEGDKGCGNDGGSPDRLVMTHLLMIITSRLISARKA